MFIDRLKRLCSHYGVTPQKGLFSDAHSTLDTLDDVAGIRTRYPPGHDGCCSMSYYPFDKCRRYVGARVALHEAYINTRWDVRAVNRSPQKYFHWLGKDAL